MILENQAWKIAKCFAQDVARLTGEHLIAVSVIGSLASGFYRPGKSDIDTVVILRDDYDDEMVESVKALAHQYSILYNVPKGFGAVIIREQELSPPYDPEREFVPEILRLKRQGIVILGDYNLQSIPEPSQEDFQAYTKVFYPWLKANYIDRRPNKEKTVDSIVNTILYELRLLVWSVTGEYVMDKPDVIPKFFTIKNTRRFNHLLIPIQNYLTNHDKPGDIRFLEDALREVSDFVRQEVPL
jgi:predicted nucleotidyltransferase